ncbi:MAG: hypothetical protein SGJ10_03065 [Bacteroidota bacterium]|nr:hypothetical protein [Bacteroidota bacterium]
MRWLKNGSFGFACVSVCVAVAKPNVPFVRLAKIVFKKVRRKKNKKHRFGLSVGLLAVPLQYGLYVFGHLSKWFVVVLLFKF